MERTKNRRARASAGKDSREALPQKGKFAAQADFWALMPFVPESRDRRQRDEKLDSFIAKLPTPLADEVLHREVLGEIEDAFGVSEEKRDRFDQRLKTALERFIRGYAVLARRRPSPW